MDFLYSNIATCSNQQPQLSLHVPPTDSQDGAPRKFYFTAFPVLFVTLVSPGAKRSQNQRLNPQQQQQMRVLLRAAIQSAVKICPGINQFAHEWLLCLYAKCQNYRHSNLFCNDDHRKPGTNLASVESWERWTGEGPVVKRETQNSIPRSSSFDHDSLIFRIIQRSTNAAITCV